MGKRGSPRGTTRELRGGALKDKGVGANSEGALEGAIEGDRGGNSQGEGGKNGGEANGGGYKRRY